MKNMHFFSNLNRNGYFSIKTEKVTAHLVWQTVTFLHVNFMNPNASLDLLGSPLKSGSQ